MIGSQEQNLEFYSQTTEYGKDVISARPEVLERVPMALSSSFMLGAFLEGPKHGYEVMQDTEELSGGISRVAVGNVYTLLKRFERLGLLVEITTEENDRRRIYQLTSLGEDVLKAQYEIAKRFTSHFEAHY